MGLEHVLPQEAGVNPEGIIDLLEALGKKNCHSIVILRHGKIITEGWWKPYSKELPHILYSLSKSFTSIALAFAFEEGILSPDDYVFPYFKEYFTSEPCDYFKKLKIRHLLSMTMGHRSETEYIPYENWSERFVKQYIENEPGKVFYYDNGDPYLAAVILNKITGLSLEEYLKKRLFIPLGFQNYSWEKSPENYSKAFCGLNLCTEDIAKFGQFLLNKGMWEGKRLLGEKYVEEAVKSHIDNRGDGTGYPDCMEGYGYLFWRCKPEGAYRGDGANGQYCVVMPKQDMVVAITSGWEPMNEILETVWEKLLPALDQKKVSDQEKQLELEKLAENLQISAPTGDKVKTFEFKEKQYEFTANPLGIEKLSVIREDHCSFTFITKEGSFTYPADSQNWTYAENDRGEEDCLKTTFFKRSYSCGVWTEEGYQLHILYINTPFHDTYTMKFEKGYVRINYKRFPVQVYHQDHHELIGAEMESINPFQTAEMEKNYG